MILINTGTDDRFVLDAEHHRSTEILAQAPWVDLVDPTDRERALVEQATRLVIPSKANLSEIESSSRLNSRNGVLTLSMPMIARSDQETPRSSPLGFVLTPEKLLTVRYDELRAFDTFATRFTENTQHHTGPYAFLGLLEAVVDRLADILERVGSNLDDYSRQVFRPDITADRADRYVDRQLHDMLRTIGRNNELISKLRDSLLGVTRIISFVTDNTADHLAADMAARAKTMRQDLLSLTDYDTQLANKVQFLLDATLGFINIQQNNVVKTLTVASIVGIPPVLIAGIYGMNFTDIPELKWAYGYPYSLLAMALSAVLPLIWFKRKGWL